MTPIEQATRLAQHSECPIVRQLLTELLAVIDERDKRIEELERINADVLRCNQCLNDVANEAWPK